MHITIVTIGSQGDVQPCIALGHGLGKSGHKVRIATHEIFASLVQRYGMEFAPIEGDPRQEMAAQSGQKWMESGDSMVKFISRMRGLTAYENINKGLNDILAACQGTQAILYTVLGAGGYHVAERMKIPALYLLLQPFSRSRQVPSIFSPPLPLGGFYNWCTYIITELLLWQTLRVPFNRWRRESLKLKPVPFKGPFDALYEKKVPYIYGFSKYVVPRASDWPSWHHVSGYWFLDGDQSWAPPPGLERFLAGGSKPVSIGFGSMSGNITRRLAELAVEAVSLTGQRAVLLGGWAAAQDLELPDTIYALESAPHHWLFPRMAAVVHHGGAGTTAAGLRAGVPTVIVPFFGDQPFWGRRVHALGVGPTPIPRARLTAKRLAEAITQAVGDQNMQSQAAALGEKIRSEDGVANAVEIINGYL